MDYLEIMDYCGYDLFTVNLCGVPSMSMKTESPGAQGNTSSFPFGITTARFPFISASNLPLSSAFIRVNPLHPSQYGDSQLRHIMKAVIITSFFQVFPDFT